MFHGRTNGMGDPLLYTSLQFYLFCMIDLILSKPKYLSCLPAYLLVILGTEGVDAP